MGMNVGEFYKEYVINCFELTQADGGGLSSQHVAYIASQEEGEKWVAGSQWPRYCKPFHKVYRIAHDLKGMQALREEYERDKALAKLTPRERELLGL